MTATRRLVLLVQLPIPPPGPQPIHANVPLAAGYLKLFARRRGLEEAGFRIEILPPVLANTWGDQGLVEEILSRGPWMVGFTCYVWNVERTLWIADRLKRQQPDVRIVLGGPEITADNAWVLDHLAVDYAAIGEGEQTFADLLEALGSERRTGLNPVPRGRETGGRTEWNPVLQTGLWQRGDRGPPPLRAPLARLDDVSSPYLEGILDAAGEKVMFLETMRGCAFRCKFCYYPKSYDALHFLSREKVAANLRHAAARGAREVVFLDSTLNQRPDFEDFLRLLADNNPDRQLTFFGELRGEGIDAKTAALLQAANFSEVEIGLQSLDPHAQKLMNRKVNARAFERGARAMLDEGISVRVDLILGLPGDTVDSVRRGFNFLYDSKLYSAVQVFNLSILPGTAFREEAPALGLKHQARPPYYVLRTPTLTLEDMYELMEEAQEAFGLEFDPFPPPPLDFPETATGPVGFCRIDLDAGPAPLPPPARRTQVFALWLRSADFEARRRPAAELIRQVLADNPHTTLQVILEPAAGPERLASVTLETLLAACYQTSSYLDLYYSLHPNSLLGAKRLVVLVSGEHRARLGSAWIDLVGEYATIVWRGGAVAEEELAPSEHVLPQGDSTS